MTTYKAQPKKKDTPSRKLRKSERKKVFLYNKYEAKKEAKEAREKKLKEAKGE